MQTTKILLEEHVWIRRLLECLEKLAGDSSETGTVDAEASAELLLLFQEFADGWHQEGEEQYLFPRLLARSSAEEGAVIRGLLKEHESEVQLMLSMRSNLLGAEHGESLSLREFVRQAREYVELQRKHMAKETAVVLPLAERLLTAADDQAIMEGIDGLLSGGPQARERVFERVRGLCERLEVSVDSRIRTQ